MDAALDESPIEEYERQLAERRARFGRRIEGVLAQFCAWHGLALLFLFVTILVAEPAAAIVMFVFWLTSAVAAGVAGVLGLMNWPILSRVQKALVLAPWALIVVEFTLPFVLAGLYGP